MRPLLLAACLAAAGPALAQSADRHWRGDALRYVPPTVAGCDVAVLQAASRNGRVHVWLRHGGRGDVSFTLGGELTGNGQRSIGSVTTRLSPGRNVEVAMMQVIPGSLSGSVLALHGSACSVAS